LENLAVPLRERYLRLGGLNDLDSAVKNGYAAVDLTEDTDPSKAGLLRSLSVSLGERYKVYGSYRDLEASVESLQAGLKLTPKGHPEKVLQLQTLAVSLTLRYRRLQDPLDLQAAHSHFSESLKLSPLNPETSWRQALVWAFVAEKFDPSYAVPAYQTAFDLLPELLWIGHSIPVRHDAIRRLDISSATSNAI
jgi:hypothetical protein